MLKFFVALLVASIAFATSAVAEEAKVLAYINLDKQTMIIITEDRQYDWKVSTGREGLETPAGEYKPQWLDPKHWSKKYKAWMPHSVFFHGGYAIHATNAIKNLGHTASHGCVRLAPENAAEFFKIVEEYGKDSVKIIVFHEHKVPSPTPEQIVAVEAIQLY